MQLCCVFFIWEILFLKLTYTEKRKIPELFFELFKYKMLNSQRSIGDGPMLLVYCIDLYKNNFIL